MAQGAHLRGLAIPPLAGGLGAVAGPGASTGTGLGGEGGLGLRLLMAPPFPWFNLTSPLVGAFRVELSSGCRGVLSAALLGPPALEVFGMDGLLRLINFCRSFSFT